MSEQTEIELIQTDKASKRCPDFDVDCYLVQDYWMCWTGITPVGSIGPAEGYCPFCTGEIGS